MAHVYALNSAVFPYLNDFLSLPMPALVHWGTCIMQSMSLDKLSQHTILILRVGFTVNNKRTYIQVNQK